MDLSFFIWSHLYFGLELTKQYSTYVNYWSVLGFLQHHNWFLDPIIQGQADAASLFWFYIDEEVVLKFTFKHVDVYPLIHANSH